MKQAKNWHTIKQVAEQRPFTTESSIRNLVHRSKENGLDSHITRMGRRVLIDLDGFDAWIEQGNNR